MGNRSGPLTFDPVVLGNREADAWAAYYRHEWGRFLVAAVGMVRVAFGMTPAKTLRGAWYVLRAIKVWSPYPDNDPDLARALMRRFYALVVVDARLAIEPATAARLEVEWWRVHREHQYDPAVPVDAVVGALQDLYAYLYSGDREAMLDAARYRVEAMDLSDTWVAAGRRADDPLLAAERRALVASHSALRDAVARTPR